MSPHRTSGLAVGLILTATVLGGCSSDPAAVDAQATPTPSPTTTVLTAQQKAAEKARIAKAPTKLAALCSDKGVKVNSATVATRREGVYVVTQSTRTSPTRLRYVATPKATPEQQFAGSLDVTEARTTAVFPVPPGSVELTCQTTEGKTIGRTTTVAVYDREGYYRAVNIEKTLGCRPQTAVDGPSAPPRATSGEAFDKLMETIPGSGTFTYTAGPGYAGSTVDTALVKQDGKGFGTAVAELQPNGAYVARLTSTC